MTKRQSQKKAQSTYVKYQKSPYIYAFKTCKHTRSVFQSLPATNSREGWSGHVCATCNITTKADRDTPRGFRAEAA